MTFDELMYGISFVTPLFCTLSAGRAAGFLGVVIALVVGAGLGICSFYMVRGLFKWVRRHPELGKRNPDGPWMLLSWGLCVAMFACIGGIGVLGILVTKLVTNHVLG